MVLAITQCNKTYPKTDNSIEIRKKQEPDYPGPLLFYFLISPAHFICPYTHNALSKPRFLGLR